MAEPADLLHAGEDALASARLLFQAGRWADAISRAYYAMLYAARALLASEGQSSKTHRGTVALLQQHFVRTGRLPAEIAKLLPGAMAFRERADYGVRTRLTKEDAGRTIEAAGRFLEATKGAVRRTP